MKKTHFYRLSTFVPCIPIVFKFSGWSPFTNCLNTFKPLCLVFWSLFLYWSLSTLLYSLAAKLWVLLVAGMFYYTGQQEDMRYFRKV